jgi:hypothetical protein
MDRSMLRDFAFAVFALLMLSACTTVRETNPPRTASEELLISTAADRAADKLSPAIPNGTKVFVDAAYLDGTDAKYATATMRDRLLRLGAHLMVDRKSADMVVELRSGALSIDQRSFLIGIPSFPVPIPLAGTLEFPEIALYKRVERKGIAKFAATGYDANRQKDDVLPKDDE